MLSSPSFCFVCFLHLLFFGVVNIAAFWWDTVSRLYHLSFIYYHLKQSYAFDLRTSTAPWPEIRRLFAAAVLPCLSRAVSRGVAPFPLQAWSCRWWVTIGRLSDGVQWHISGQITKFSNITVRRRLSSLGEWTKGSLGQDVWLLLFCMPLPSALALQSWNEQNPIFYSHTGCRRASSNVCRYSRHHVSAKVECFWVQQATICCTCQLHRGGGVNCAWKYARIMISLTWWSQR